MLDLATDVDLVLVPPSQLPVSLVASNSVASVSGCQYQLPVSLAASTSVASVSVAGRFSCQCLCLSCWYLCISCQCLGCLYLNCRCLCLGYQYILVPWLVSRSVPWLPRISRSQLLRTVARQLSRIPMSHQQKRCPVSRPSSPQTTTDHVICS